MTYITLHYMCFSWNTCYYMLLQLWIYITFLFHYIFNDIKFVITCDYISLHAEFDVGFCFKLFLPRFIKKLPCFYSILTCLPCFYINIHHFYFITFVMIFNLSLHVITSLYMQKLMLGLVFVVHSHSAQRSWDNTLKTNHLDGCCLLSCIGTRILVG